MKPLTVFKLGLTLYDEALSFQFELVEKVIESKGRNSFLMLLEHQPVITLGKNANAGNVLASQELLKKKGIEFKQASRGGDVTYHGPGQLVGYPILSLAHHKKTMREYVRMIENTIIQTISKYGLTGYIKDDKTAGVWVKSTSDATRSSTASCIRDSKTVSNAKIGFIGMRITRGITYHGFSLNVNNDLNTFELINPCGMKQPKITSVADETGKNIPMNDFMKAYVDSFKDIFGAEVVEVKTHLTYIPKEII